MNPGIIKIVTQSIRFYRKPVLYQVLIIALLSAVITGSLLTGGSVRASLKRTASERLGNTGILISSGVRYFDPGLVQRIQESIDIKCTGILEINGFCQGLNSQKEAFNTHIYAVNNDFFNFNGNDTLRINPGEAAINKRLADFLAVKPGDDIIIHFNDISAIPADAPFAPEKDMGKSIAVKVGMILTSANTGNFSLSISQVMPMNVFINPADIADGSVNPQKINRLLFDKKSSHSLIEISNEFKHLLKPSDIGLRLRMVNKSSQTELTSDRIFIDELLLKEIINLIPSSAPVITYLGNKITSGSGSTPYSFVSALPSSIYPEISSGNGVIINTWMAHDLAVNEGDTVNISWYKPDSLNKLVENNTGFVIKKIVEMKGIWSDSLLMPDFPGISGSESCSDWDAGVPIKMNEIRSKDEDYWNKHRGTPKAFINYEKGSELWGNNFGPATSLRFPIGLTSSEIESKLIGSLDPLKIGFTFNDLSTEATKAANASVDFGTLFLSLGFFLIVASIILLSLTVSSYFDSKREQISTLFALGFKKQWIQKLVLLESVLIGLIGCIIGVYAGYLVNILITRALNSVWQGAVQTDTLDAFFTIVPVITGFFITILIYMVFMFFRIRRFLKRLNRKEREYHLKASTRQNLLLLVPTVILTISLFIFSLIFKNKELPLSFAAGAFLLFTLILLLRQYVTRRDHINPESIFRMKGPSHGYYSFNPSHAVTPVLFIAAGIFAVFITGANKMNFNEKHLNRSGGTGGYLLWCESTIPIKDDLNSLAGKKKSGLDTDSLSEMSFVQIKRSSGNDASCLNLNYITAPPLLGVDPAFFLKRESFSFQNELHIRNLINPWEYLNLITQKNTIYGIADQTVLEWGLKLKIGDTLTLRAENGQSLNIIIAAGLQSSVFQGFVLIGKDNFTKYYPSVSGSSVILVDGNSQLTDLYKNTLEDRLENYGINIEKTTNRLASFYQVTNTYLSVFGVFGALGMITAIAGLGFVLLRNYNQRKKEFALMMATGFSVKAIRRIILSEQILILFAGVFSGIISAIVATLPSIKGSPDIPWMYLILMVLAIIITGLTALFLAVRTISANSLTASLKKD